MPKYEVTTPMGTISHGSEQYEVDEKGQVEVPAEIALELKAAGFLTDIKPEVVEEVDPTTPAAGAGEEDPSDFQPVEIVPDNPEKKRLLFGPDFAEKVAEGATTLNQVLDNLANALHPAQETPATEQNDSSSSPAGDEAPVVPPDSAPVVVEPHAKHPMSQETKDKIAASLRAKAAEKKAKEE